MGKGLRLFSSTQLCTQAWTVSCCIELSQTLCSPDTARLCCMQHQKLVACFLTARQSKAETRMWLAGHPRLHGEGCITWHPLCQLLKCISLH